MTEKETVIVWAETSASVEALTQPPLLGQGLAGGAIHLARGWRFYTVTRLSAPEIDALREIGAAVQPAPRSQLDWIAPQDWQLQAALGGLEGQV